MATIRLDIVIQLDDGTFMISEGATAVTGADSAIFARGGVLTYPDLRVRQFVVTVGAVVRVFPAHQSTTLNLSYAITEDEDGEDGSVFDAAVATDPAVLSAITGDADRNQNAIWVSELYRPLDLRAGRALTLGTDRDDPVRAVVPMGMPLSEGQAGQYPLVAFCRRSRWAIEVGSGDVAFSRTYLLDNRGIVSHRAAINIDGRIYVASHDGVFEMSGSQTVELSAPIRSQLIRRLTNQVCFGYYTDFTGRRELWVATAASSLGAISYAAQVYVFSLVHRCWTVLTRQVDAFARTYVETGAALTDDEPGEVPLYTAGVIGASNVLFQEPAVAFYSLGPNFHLFTAPIRIPGERLHWLRISTVSARADGSNYTSLSLKVHDINQETGAPLTLGTYDLIAGSIDGTPNGHAQRLSAGLVLQPHLSLTGRSNDPRGCMIERFDMDIEPRFPHRQSVYRSRVGITESGDIPA